MARKAAVRHPDFTIVFRKDRNGFEGWYGGKAEAFRVTEEKVQSFFQKKYGKPGVLVDAAPVNQPAVISEKKPNKAKPKVVATVTVKKPAKTKPVAPVLDPVDFEDTDLDPLQLL